MDSRAQMAWVNPVDHCGIKNFVYIRNKNDIVRLCVYKPLHNAIAVVRFYSPGINFIISGVFCTWDFCWVRIVYDINDFIGETRELLDVEIEFLWFPGKSVC